ncbi:MAG: TolC family protein [Gemmatimonadetes bacterium]|nr:TolC family protein [Gemmatimonadota bacterium]
MNKILVLALGAWGVGQIAFVPVTAAVPLTESEFLGLLNEDHPAVEALRAEVAESSGEMVSWLPNPDVAWEREALDGEPAQTTVTVRWQPPLDGRRGLERAAARAGRDAAELRLGWERMELRARVRELYARWVTARDIRDLFAQLTHRTEALAARARARAEAGEESGLAAGRLTLAAADVKASAARAERDLQVTLAEVRTLFPDLDVSRTPAAPALPEPPSYPEPAGSAVPAAATRPDVRARELDLERASRRHRLNGRFLEFPALTAGWTSLDAANDPGGPVLGVEWTVPLFDRGPGPRKQSAEELRVARAELELGRRAAAAELIAAHEAYRTLRAAALDLMEATARAEAVTTGATAEFEAGESTLTDLLETLRSVADSRAAALEMRHEALAAHRELERSVGRALTAGSDS